MHKSNGKTHSPVKLAKLSVLPFTDLFKLLYISLFCIQLIFGRLCDARCHQRSTISNQKWQIPGNFMTFSKHESLQHFPSGLQTLWALCTFVLGIFFNLPAYFAYDWSDTILWDWTSLWKIVPWVITKILNHGIFVSFRNSAHWKWKCIAHGAISLE